MDERLLAVCRSDQDDLLDESEILFCAVCNEYRYLEDELSECCHLFFSIGGEWRGSGDTERGDCPYDDYLKEQILKFAEGTGCKDDLIQALKQPDNKEAIRISGSWSGACIHEFVINGVDYEAKAEDTLFEDVQQGDDTLEVEFSDGFDAMMTLVPQYYPVILEFLEAQSENN